MLGLVLGDILDKSLRRGLVLSDGSILPFFTRPLSAVVAVLVIYTFLSNIPSVRAASAQLLSWALRLTGLRSASQ